MYQECGAMQHCPLRRLLLAERRITPSRRVHVRDIDSTLGGCVDSASAFESVHALIPSAVYFGFATAYSGNVRGLLRLRRGLLRHRPRPTSAPPRSTSAPSAAYFGSAVAYSGTVCGLLRHRPPRRLRS